MLMRSNKLFISYFILLQHFDDIFLFPKDEYNNQIIYDTEFSKVWWNKKSSLYLNHGFIFESCYEALRIVSHSIGFF